MRIRICLLTAAIAFVAAGSAAWAALPFGSFGGQVSGDNAGSGLIHLHGWALDDDGVRAVDIIVAPCAPEVQAGACNPQDATVAGRAIYGRSRPGATQTFPGFPDSAAPGFAFLLDSTRYPNGLHRVTPRVLSNSGEIVFLRPRVFEFHNTSHNLVPFGKVEFPNHGSEMRGNCNISDPARRWSIVSGYAIDLGLTEEDTGVGYVELLIDRASFANTEVDCRYDPSTGGDGEADCYGRRRTDLVRFFPSLKDEPHVGFRFAIDIGALLFDPDGGGPKAAMYTRGSHVITVRAGDHADQLSNIAEFPVTFTCDETIHNEESVGDIFTPSRALIQAGVVRATGWALDWEGVQSVQIWVDGVFVTTATYGLVVPDSLSSLYPGFPDVAAAHWEAFIDTNTLSDSEHEMEVIVVDVHGDSTYVGRRTFVVDNPPPGP